MRMSKPKLLFLGLVGIVSLILIWLYINNYLYKTKAANVPTNNSANRQIWWIAASRSASELTCATMTDAELDKFKSWGIGGFVCQNAYLGRGMGGGEWTGQANADALNNPTNSNYSRYDVQRKLRDSNIVARAHARGMKMYLGFWAANYYNGKTFYREWFDDNGWNGVVIPNIRDISGAAKLMSFDGLNIDQENYGNPSGTPSWTHPGTSPGGTTDAQVRAKVKQRGQEVMKAMLQSYTGESLEVMFYYNLFPGGWEALVQCEVNGYCGLDDSLGAYFIDFWDGMSSVNGYKALRFQDAIFYKGTQRSASLDTALQYNANKIYAYISRRFSNWDYAASRFAVSPFIWIDDDCALEGGFAANRSTGVVAEQLVTYRKWGVDGQFSNFVYSGNLKTKNYADYYSADCPPKVPGYDSQRPYNYLPAIKNTAVSGVVDSEFPTLNLTAPTTGSTFSTPGGTVNISGNAHDNLAIRFVKWKNDRGGEGTAQMRWKVLSGDYHTSYNWQMDWVASNVSLQQGTNVITITTEDIKGLVTAKTLIVTAGSSSPITSTPAPHIPTPTQIRTTITPTLAPTQTPTRAPTNSPTIPPANTALSLNLFLHGIGRGGDSANFGSVGNVNPLRMQRTVQVEIFNSQNQLSLSKIGQVNFDTASGSFKGTVDLGTTLSTGVYTVKVKSDQFLKVLIPGIQTITRGQTNQLPQVTLIAGDINGDNKTDILDYSILMGCYSDILPAASCTQLNKSLADLTDDGNVNQFDYNLFLRELINRGGE